MKKYAFVAILLLQLISGSAQLTADYFWPQMKTIPRAYVGNTNITSWVFAGPVEGDCKNGPGIYLAVQQVEKTNFDNPLIQNFAYRIWKGNFREDGKYFSGTRYYILFNIKQRKEKADFDPVEKIDFTEFEKHADWPDWSGNFKRYKSTKWGDYMLYREDGEARHLYTERKKGYLQYSGVYTYGGDAYLRIDFPEGNSKKKFRGYTDRYRFYTLGRLELSNGDVYEGALSDGKYEGPGRLVNTNGVQQGIWRQGKLIRSMNLYIPDTNTLKKAISNNNEFPSDTLTVRTPPMQFEEGSNYSIEGVFAASSSGDTSMKSATGLFYKDNNTFYFGGVKNSRPDGFGYLRLNDDSHSGNFLLSAGDQVSYGDFEHGWFRSGTMAVAQRDKESGDYKDYSFKKIGPFKSEPGEDEERDALMAYSNHEDAKGLQLLMCAVALGNANGSFYLGKKYSLGKELPADEEKAVALYKVAAAKNHTQAMIYLAHHLQTGNAIEKNIPLAREWYKKAAYNGNAEAGKEMLKIDFPLMTNLADDMVKMSESELDFYRLVQRDLEKEMVANANGKARYKQPIVSDGWQNPLIITQPTTNYKIVFYHQSPIDKFTISMYHVEEQRVGETVHTYSLTLSSQADGKFDADFYKAQKVTFTAPPLSGSANNTYNFEVTHGYDDFVKQFGYSKIAWVILVEQ